MAQLELLQSASTHDAYRKSESAFKTISEVEIELDVPQHVLRFWESHFPQVKPRRMNGSRRYYRPEDVDLLKKIKTLLYAQGYTIKGAKKLIKEKGLIIDAVEPASAEMPAQTLTSKVTEVPRKKADKPDVKSLVSELRILKSMLATLL